MLCTLELTLILIIIMLYCMSVVTVVRQISATYNILVVHCTVGEWCWLAVLVFR